MGYFTLIKANDSWSKKLTIGIFDYYQNNNIDVFQIIPDNEHYTMEIPDMSSEFDEDKFPAWRWLTDKWPYSVSLESKVFTDIDVLLGINATEVMRWEEKEWEVFSGDSANILKENMRVVPISTIIVIDSSLESILYLDIKKGLWRESINDKWNDWG